MHPHNAIAIVVQSSFLYTCTCIYVFVLTTVRERGIAAGRELLAVENIIFLRDA